MHDIQRVLEMLHDLRFGPTERHSKDKHAQGQLSETRSSKRAWSRFTVCKNNGMTVKCSTYGNVSAKAVLRRED